MHETNLVRKRTRGRGSMATTLMCVELLRQPPSSLGMAAADACLLGRTASERRTVDIPLGSMSSDRVGRGDIRFESNISAYQATRSNLAYKFRDGLKGVVAPKE